MNWLVLLMIFTISLDLLLGVIGLLIRRIFYLKLFRREFELEFSVFLNWTLIRSPILIDDVNGLMLIELDF